MRDEFLRTDSWRSQRQRTIEQLGHAYVLVRELGNMDATPLDVFVSILLQARAADQIDAVLEHLNVAPGAWRELADHAYRAIEGVAAALARAVLARAAIVEVGSA